MNFLAYFYLLMKGIIYGSTPYFTGQLSESCDVLDLLALRFLLSFFVMWLLKSLKIIKISVGIKNFIKKEHRLPRMKYLLLTALFEPVLYMFFETIGIAMTTSITTAVILSLAPISTTVLEWVNFRTHPTPLQGVFLACGIFGAIYIAVNTSTQGGKSSAVGIIFLIAAVLCGGMYCVFSKKSSAKYTVWDITYTPCLLGTLVFNLVNVIRHVFCGNLIHYFDPYFVPENLLGFFVLGVASTIIATAMNNYAISKVQMSTLSAFGGVSTIVIVFIGVVFGAESIQVYHLIGFPFIFARMIGVSAISIIKDKKMLEMKKAEQGSAQIQI